MLEKVDAKFRRSLTLFFLPVSHNISTSLHFCHGERGAVVCRRRLGRRFGRCHRRSVRVLGAQRRRDREAPGVQRAGRWILCCCHHHSLLLVTPQIFSHFENSILLSLSSMIFCRVPYLSGGYFNQSSNFMCQSFALESVIFSPREKKRKKSTSARCDGFSETVEFGWRSTPLHSGGWSSKEGPVGLAPATFN